MFKLLRYLFFTIYFLHSFESNAQSDSIQDVPFSLVFKNLPSNFGKSFTYNHGVNTVLACAGTYVLIKSKADWEWYSIAKENKVVAYSGMPSLILGGIVPLTVPLGLYYYGKNRDDKKLQVVALAMGQAAILAVSISSGIKAFTGRKHPEILNNKDHSPDFSTDFKFGFLNRGAFNGWPSGHTMTAFAMATTLVEFYPDNSMVRIGAYSYATVIGLGISVNIHWLSDAFAGALMGYAIGKTVGKSFTPLVSGKSPEDSKLSIYPTSNGLGIIYKF